MDNKVKIFEDKKIRTVWNEETEEWYLSVSDVVEHENKNKLAKASAIFLNLFIRNTPF